MADEVKPIEWGRVREWDGSKGCPPVAHDKFSALLSGKWYGMTAPDIGRNWIWDAHDIAYRIPAEFDHLDDYGNPVDPFAGYTAAELRAVADAKDAAEFERLKPWLDLLRSANEANQPGVLGGGLNAARVVEEGAAKLLGVTL